ncbi:hypothetical protein [Roseobacter weihaiensis]|uniref:hypothetical protein n=1 Tax=Roseobacter weihaiensis TaxID=2763262 RepID=UPI001D0BE40F|nr:hypothetical protein [Roseobacter sp. H9]
MAAWDVTGLDDPSFAIGRRFGETSSRYDVDAVLKLYDEVGMVLDQTVVNNVVWDADGNHSLHIDDFVFV